MPPRKKSCKQCAKPHYLYGWDEFFLDVTRLARKIQESDAYKKSQIQNVYGPPQGGLIPAAFVATLLHLPLICSEHEVVPRTLFLDDIIESGKTYARTRPLNLAALWLFEDSPLTPQWYVRIKKRAMGWIQYPWEDAYTTHLSMYRHLKS